MVWAGRVLALLLLLVLLLLLMSVDPKLLLQVVAQSPPDSLPSVGACNGAEVSSCAAPAVSSAARGAACISKSAWPTSLRLSRAGSSGHSVTRSVAS